MISCIEYANEVKHNIQNRVYDYGNVVGKTPTLAILTVGNDKASESYVKGKIKDCEEVGIYCRHYKYEGNVTEDELINDIRSLNINPHISGIIVQLPLPKHINTDTISSVIDSDKDVDGFKEDSAYEPCTALGIINLLNYYNIDLYGLNCVVIGRSKIVGEPLARLLLAHNATVTVCHSKTKDLSLYTKNADIVFSCVGKKGLLTKEMLRKNTIVIDVGITRSDDGKLYGDLDRVCYGYLDKYTTVPNGIGLVTRVTLLENVMMAAEINQGLYNFD